MLPGRDTAALTYLLLTETSGCTFSLCQKGTFLRGIPQDMYLACFLKELQNSQVRSWGIPKFYSSFILTSLGRSDICYLTDPGERDITYCIVIIGCAIDIWSSYWPETYLLKHNAVELIFRLCLYLQNGMNPISPNPPSFLMLSLLSSDVPSR